MRAKSSVDLNGISKKQAMHHFREDILPRRTRDTQAEAKYFEEHKKHKNFYRRVLPGEDDDNAEPYPVLGAGLQTFAHFGIGIGIYFMQLISLFLLFLIGGGILSISVYEYYKPSYGVTSDTNFLIPLSAACPAAVNVSACATGTSVGSCASQSTLTGMYRENCELPYSAALADLVMSVFMFVAISLTKLTERSIEEELDEAVQSAQDYSVVVNDPTEDADDPDEWCRFFSKFGKVRYITITRKNNHLTQLIAQKHTIAQKILNLSKATTLTPKMEKKLASKYELVNKRLEKAYEQDYPICRVYVTFEYEESQRACLEALEVPDIDAMFDIHWQHPFDPNLVFRGENTLDVVEPPEPDSIIWENVEKPTVIRQTLKLLSILLTLAVFVSKYFLINYVAQVHPLLLSAVIGIVDSMLPIIFQVLTDMSGPLSEGERQSSLQLRLFTGRMLITTIFPFLRISWRDFLDKTVIQSIIIVQLSACFLTPIIKLFDGQGLVMRHVIGPCFSDTQAELNASFNGSTWSLADNYTGIVKIVFVSLFYALLNPAALLIGMIAFLMVFLIDRFLLLRRLRPSCMLDAEIAVRLRQQTLLAIAAHMYVTIRFMYSWPMDDVAVNSDGSFEIVDKKPSFFVFGMASTESWFTDGQRRIFRTYLLCFFIIGGLTVYIWIISPILKIIKGLFCYQRNSVGDSQGIPFTNVDKTTAYVPTLNYNNESYVCSYTTSLQSKNKPSLVRPIPNEKDDLSSYVPIHKQPHILSIVRFYGNGDDVDDLEGGAGGDSNKELLTKYSTVGNKKDSGKSAHPPSIANAFPSNQNLSFHSLREEHKHGNNNNEDSISLRKLEMQVTKHNTKVLTAIANELSPVSSPTGSMANPKASGGDKPPLIPGTPFAVTTPGPATATPYKPNNNNTAPIAMAPLTPAEEQIRKELKKKRVKKTKPLEMKYAQVPAALIFNPPGSKIHPGTSEGGGGAGLSDPTKEHMLQMAAARKRNRVILKPL